MAVRASRSPLVWGDPHGAPWALVGRSLPLVVANASLALGGVGVAVLIGRGLGPAAYGQYSVAMATALLATALVEFGTGTALAREVAALTPPPRSAAAGQEQRLLWAALLGKGAAGAVAAAALAALALHRGGEAGMALLALAPLPGLAAAFAACTALLRAGGRTLAILLLNAGGIALQLAGAAVLLTWRPPGEPLPILLAWFTLVQACQLGAALALQRAEAGSDRHPRGSERGGPRANLAHPGAGADAASFGVGRLAWRLWWGAWPFALAGFLGMAALRADLLIVSRALGEEATGWYGVGGRLLEALKWAPNAYLAVLFPLLAALSAATRDGRRDGSAPSNGVPPSPRAGDDAGRAASLVTRRSLRLLGLGSAALALAALVLVAPLVDLVYGPAFAPAVAPARALLLGLPATCLSAALLLRGFAGGQERRLLVVLAGALVLKVAGVAGGLATGGLVGAALGSALAEWGGLALAGCWWRWWSSASPLPVDERGATRPPGFTAPLLPPAAAGETRSRGPRPGAGGGAT